MSHFFIYKTMNKRLRAFLNYKGTTLAQLERDIGVGAGTLSKAVKNDSSIGVDKVMKILQLYGELSAEWLLRGDGDMLLGVANDSANSVKVALLEEQVHQLTAEKEKYWSLIEHLTKNGQ